MIDKFSRLHWATLIILALFASAARLAAEETGEGSDASALANSEEAEAAPEAEDDSPEDSVPDSEAESAPESAEEPAVITPVIDAQTVEAAEESAEASTEADAQATLPAEEPIELPKVIEPAAPIKPAEVKAPKTAKKLPAAEPALKSPVSKPPVAKTAPAKSPIAKSPSPATKSPASPLPSLKSLIPKPAVAKPTTAKPTTVAPDTAESTASESTGAELAAEIENSPLMPAPQQAAIETASFQGVQPGRTTSNELAEAWGPPKEIRKAAGQRAQVYAIESFPKVTATISEDVVSSIMVTLEKPYESEDLAEELHLESISSVQVTDDQGRLLGEAFPERGVLFSYSPNEKQPRVSQVVFEPVDSQPFLFRGETYLRTHYSRCLSDANSALEIDPKCAAAHALRARVYFQSGDFDLALRAAKDSAAIEASADSKLLLARIMIEVLDFTRARGEIRAVLDDKNSDSLAKARAYCLLGDCVALAPAGEEDAMAHHMQAIKLAEKLTSNKSMAVRRAAKEVLLDAHLGVARDIGWGRWQQKSAAIIKWIDRAGALAQDLVRNEQAGDELPWRVDRIALEALAGAADPGDVAGRISECLRRAHDLIEGSGDPARTAQLKWQFGLALANAVEIEHVRNQNDRALRYGRLSVKLLEAGNAAGRQLPNHDFLVGRACYTLGVIEAVGEQDHAKACEWYGRAVKLLETPVPPARLADPGKQGEAFVSMAVSYWESKDRDEAMRLTKQGLRLMEKAVEDGLLSKAALAVPYGNLSSMHAELGDKQLAAEFSALASKCEGPKR